MFSARGVALNVTTARVQLRVLHNVYLSAWLQLRGTNSIFFQNVSEVLPHIVGSEVLTAVTTKTAVSCGVKPGF
jgi:hypothetical protein